MNNAITVVGWIYTTLSLAILPVAILSVVVLMLGFEEHGSQSQGAGALLVISAIVLLVIGVNAIIAGSLSYFIESVRPTVSQVGIAFISMTTLAGLFYYSLK